MEVGLFIRKWKNKYLVYESNYEKLILPRRGLEYARRGGKPKQRRVGVGTHSGPLN